VASYEAVFDDIENKFVIRITFTYQELNELPSLDHFSSEQFCEHLLMTVAGGPRPFLVTPHPIFHLLTHLVALALGAFIHALVHAH